MTEQIHTLDARGLNCPLPILRTKKAISGIHSGEILEVTATDPGSIKDMAAFCKQTGNELLSSNENSGDYVFRIRKA
jgi:tRNA 2-thiouridine synthesizing protein A